MNSSSNSTLLVNCLIALSTKSSDFPYPLWNNGFQIETIEPRILLSDGSSANPDIQFKRIENSLLFFECKDGNCEKDQLDRYKKITIDDINRHHVTSLTAADIVFDLAYFTTKLKEEKIIQSVEKDANPFPILILEENCIKLNPISNEFKIPLLNDILREVPFQTSIPQNYIPFTVDDDDRIIMCALLQHFISKIDYEFTLDQLLEELFSHFIHNYSLQGKNNLKERIGKLLKTLIESDDFLGIIIRRGNSYFVKTTAPKRFMNNCSKKIKEMKEEIKKENDTITSPQLTLTRFLGG